MILRILRRGGTPIQLFFGRSPLQFVFSSAGLAKMNALPRFGVATQRMYWGVFKLSDRILFLSSLKAYFSFKKTFTRLFDCNFIQNLNESLQSKFIFIRKYDLKITE